MLFYTLYNMAMTGVDMGFQLSGFKKKTETRMTGTVLLLAF